MKQQNILSTFKNAIEGCGYFFRNERNGKIQLVAAIITVGAGIWLKISGMEWTILLLCITAVFSLEMLNSAIERVCDLVQPGFHPLVKVIKDVAAGAVLVAAIASVIVGAIVFVPKLIIMLNGHGHI